jgi:hypothetical protein
VPVQSAAPPLSAEPRGPGQRDGPHALVAQVRTVDRRERRRRTFAVAALVVVAVTGVFVSVDAAADRLEGARRFDAERGRVTRMVAAVNQEVVAALADGRRPGLPQRLDRLQETVRAVVAPRQEGRFDEEARRIQVALGEELSFLAELRFAVEAGATTAEVSRVVLARWRDTVAAWAEVPGGLGPASPVHPAMADALDRFAAGAVDGRAADARTLDREPGAAGEHPYRDALAGALARYQELWAEVDIVLPPGAVVRRVEDATATGERAGRLAARIRDAVVVLDNVSPPERARSQHDALVRALGIAAARLSNVGGATALRSFRDRVPLAETAPYRSILAARADVDAAHAALQRALGSAAERGPG